MSMSVTAPKKLIIRNFKAIPRLPADYEDRTWTKLRQCVDAIFEQRAAHFSLEELYQSCETLCHNKMEARLYERLRGACDEHMLRQRDRIAKATTSTSFLAQLNTMWTEHCQHMRSIRNIFLYLDRTYVLQTSGLLSIWDLGLALFRSHIVQAPDIQTALGAGLLAEIERERKSEQIDRTLMRSLIRMLLDLQCYAAHFEAPFLDASRQYYHEEARRMFASLSPPEYLRRVDLCIAEESKRVEHYLDVQTKRPLIKLVERELIAEHVTALLEQGFDTMMREHKMEDLGRLYRLIARVDMLEEVRTRFAQYIKSTGAAMVDNEERDATLVQDLINFKSQLDDIMQHAFVGANTHHETEITTNTAPLRGGRGAATATVASPTASTTTTADEWKEKFNNALRESIESFINRRHNKPAELLSRFLDAKLRGKETAAAATSSASTPISSNDSLEVTLDKTLVLFRFIRGKDMFEAYYKKDLAKRLLAGKSSSVDLERSVLGKLRAECGPGFTRKLEEMFKDIELSHDLMTAFDASKQRAEAGNFDLNVRVLSQASWPTYPPAPLRLPEGLLRCQNIFENFYLGKHTGRRLQWQNALANCTLKATMPSGTTHDFNVSLFQAVVLLAFNEGDTFTFEELKGRTGMEEEEAVRTLQSLACGKVRVLSKTPMSKDINPGDRFTVNDRFTSTNRRIRINQIQSATTPEERIQTEEKVFADRQYQVDAAIVRVMKARQQMTHAQLLGEVFRMCRFPMESGDVKMRIESLIAREFIERVDGEDAGASYRYVA